MASQRDIRRRIVSVQNTRKITKAMEMVAAARLRRAQQRIEATRPYALNMLEFIGQLVRYLQVDLTDYPLLKEHRIKKVAVIALLPIGLAGAFNSNIMRGPRAGRYLCRPRRRERPGVPGRRHTTGVSGIQVDKPTSTLPSGRVPRGPGHRQRGDPAVYRRVIDRDLVYNRFKSPMEQFVTDQVILPIQEELTSLYVPADAGEHMDFLFEPSAEDVLADLLPSYIEISVFRAILEGMASEHGARMTAMRAASEAATEMIDDLTLAMNRVRQASITQEILEVVAGADALSG
jgi:F-type H+-transporting ATPase subunit gamma